MTRNRFTKQAEKLNNDLFDLNESNRVKLIERKLQQAYRRGQQNMRKAAAQAAYVHVASVHNIEPGLKASRAIEELRCE